MGHRESRFQLGDLGECLSDVGVDVDVERRHCSHFGAELRYLGQEQRRVRAYLDLRDLLRKRQELGLDGSEVGLELGGGSPDLSVRHLLRERGQKSLVLGEGRDEGFVAGRDIDDDRGKVRATH
ncbi:MAG: hypothetical protein ACYCSF_13175 [Acidimicrobiales bacterium]